MEIPLYLDIIICILLIIVFILEYKRNKKRPAEDVSKETKILVLISLLSFVVLSILFIFIGNDIYSSVKLAIRMTLIGSSISVLAAYFIRPFIQSFIK